MNWRTNDVLQIANSMRQADEYSACPILADAMQDTGFSEDVGLRYLIDGSPILYPDEVPLLLLLRDPTLPKWRAQRAVIAVLGLTEAMEAVKWIEDFAHEISEGRYFDDDDDRLHRRDYVTYEKLMDTAAEFVATDGRESGFLPYDTPDCVWEKREEFWANYGRVFGKEVTVDKDSRLFRCSC